VNALHGTDGLRGKGIAARAVSTSPIDDNALVSAVAANLAIGAEARQPFIPWSALARVVWKIFDTELKHAAP
jgi:hypothetical protein